MRAGASLAGCRALGLDLQGMIRAELVDTVLAMPPHKSGMMEQHPSGIAELVQAASGNNVKIICGISTNIRHDAFEKAPETAVQAASVADDLQVDTQYCPDVSEVWRAARALKGEKQIGCP